MLCMEIELLTGLYRAALPDGSSEEWPPHPERVFSALAQAWGDGGCDQTEEQALHWLERQDAPVIEADASDRIAERDSATVFVPPNDQHGVWISRFPERRRQGRSFWAIRPEQTALRLFWAASSDTTTVAALDRLAQRVTAIGHSASLVRARFHDDCIPNTQRLWQPSSMGRVPLRVPHPGRLQRLQDWLHNDERPRVGATQRYEPPQSQEALVARQSWFGGREDWFIFEDNDGPFVPDILGFAHVATRVRHALMSLGPQPAPAVLSGHTTDGAPTHDRHVAILPLQNVGWPYSDGRLLGFAIVLPRGLAADDRQAALHAIAAFADIGQESPQASVHLTRTHIWMVARSPDPVRKSLRPDRWCATARAWASATPVLLDRFPSTDDPAETAAILAGSCRNIGLPDPIEIEIHKHTALTGAETTYPARGNKSRPDWSFPKGSKFANRPRRHVVLRFAEPVTGPIVLGAGRFAGFGLCLPLTDGETP